MPAPKANLRHRIGKVLLAVGIACFLWLSLVLNLAAIFTTRANPAAYFSLSVYRSIGYFALLHSLILMLYVLRMNRRIASLGDVAHSLGLRALLAAGAAMCAAAVGIALLSGGWRGWDRTLIDHPYGGIVGGAVFFVTSLVLYRARQYKRQRPSIDESVGRQTLKSPQP